MTVEEIASRISKDSNGCWIWNGARTNKGYGNVRIKGKHRLVHKVIYAAFKGPIPKNLEIDHSCRIRHCCNPLHLEAVTHLENICRMLGKLKTHCIRGHLYRKVGYYLNSRGSKTCKKCHADYYKRYKRAK